MTSLQVTFLSPTGSLNKRVELSIGNHGSLVCCFSQEDVMSGMGDDFFTGDFSVPDGELE